jgi:hypothetical protein
MWSSSSSRSRPPKTKKTKHFFCDFHLDPTHTRIRNPSPPAMATQEHELHQRLEVERVRTEKLREEVRQLEHKLEQVHATQRTVEANTERVYLAAKRRIKACDSQLRALQAPELVAAKRPAPHAVGR